jgi:hypothetical protein
MVNKDLSDVFAFFIHHHAQLNATIEVDAHSRLPQSETALSGTPYLFGSFRPFDDFLS